MKMLIIIAALFSVLLYSCKKTIDVELNSSTPRYVVTGDITDQPGPYIVRISKSVDYDKSNNFPPVSGAAVYITDATLSLTDTLTELYPGTYQTHFIKGSPGHMYSLKIITGDETFSSTATMPMAITIDSLYTKDATFGDGTDIVALYNDPAGIRNFYRLLLTVKDSLSQEIYVHSDDITGGSLVTHTLKNDIEVFAGDTITVSLQCIDESVYKYFYDLRQTVEQNSFTLSNPQTNIQGNALGYFSAHAIRSKSMVAP